MADGGAARSHQRHPALSPRFAAHTPELLAVADRVVVLEGGRVVGPKA